MLKMSLAHRARRAVWHIGIDVRRLEPPESAKRTAALLATHDVTLVVDGGANAGGYGANLRESGYRQKIISTSHS